MSKIFLSHSSLDNGPAIAIAEWLKENGWDEYFLDLDPERGIAAGERWERALYQAATRCEAVLFLISRNWLASPWCLREMELAYKLNKHIFAVLIDDTPRAAVPKTISPWQMANLHRGQDHALIEVKLPDQRLAQVTFSRAGLAALKAGLRRAQIDSIHYVWPPEGEPDRAPWRGLEPLESRDAGIFFGRDGQIIGALDKIRALREAAPPRLMAIIGASGAGKSSFLRAGLIPRLKRDDHNYLVLPVIRPEGGALKSLTASLGQTALDLRLGLAQHDIGKAVSQAAEGNPQELSALLTRMAETARPPIIDGEAAPPPAIVLPIDQGEELFHSSGRAAGSAFLSLLTRLLLLDSPRLLALVTIRSDSYDLLQRARELEDIRHEAFSLPPLARGNYVDVIRRPLEVLNRHLSNSGHSLKFDPSIIERLTATLDEGAGRDALPLLAFTLARLYRDFHARGHITVADYDAVGGISGSIDAAVDSALARAAEDRRTSNEAVLEDMLRQTMIPRFAGIDPETGTARRRAARYDMLPSEALPLVDALIAERLLTRDNDTVEPAHEALLREWKALTQWLAEDREQLITLEGVQRAAADWEANRQHKDYLAHREGRLASAEGLVQRPDLWGGFTETDHAYLRACREAENATRAGKERIKRIAAIFVGVFFVAAIAAAWVAVDQRKEATNQRNLAEAAEEKATKQAQIATNAAEEAKAARIVAEERSREATEAEAEAKQQNTLATAERMKAELARREADQSTVNALALLALSRAESDPVGALKLVLGAWPQAENRLPPSPLEVLKGLWGAQPEVEIGPFPLPRTAFQAVSTALTRVRPYMRLHGHERPIYRIAFSPDGTRIFSMSDDGMLLLWDVETGTQIGSPITIQAATNFDVSFSSNGERIVSAGSDGVLRLWDANTGRQVGEPMIGHEGVVGNVAFSRDGTRIVSFGGPDNTLRFWDSKTGEQIGEPLTEQRNVAFSDGGTHFVNQNLDGTLRLWDMEARAQLGKPMSESDSNAEIAVSRDGMRIVTGYADGTLQLWDPITGDKIGEPMAGHEIRIDSVAFSSDGKRIASGDHNGILRILNTEARELIGNPLHEHDVWIESIAFSPDGTHIATGDYDGKLLLWDITNTQVNWSINGENIGVVRGTAFSPDGSRIVSGSGDGTVRLWDVATGEKIGNPATANEYQVLSVAFSSDGNRIVSANGDTLHIWNAKTNTPIGKPMVGHASRIDGVAFSYDGERIVSGDADGTLRLWDARTQEQIGKPMVGHGWSDGLFRGINSVTFAPEDKRIVSGGDDGTILIWDPETQEQIGWPMTGHQNMVRSVAFSPDGSRIVSGSSDRTIRLWDAETSEQIGEPMIGHMEAVESVAFSPNDNTRIASGGWDGTVRLWDVKTRTQIGEPMIGHDGWVNSVAFSPDGKHIVSAGQDGTLRLWDVSYPPGNILQIACHYLPVINGRPDTSTDGLTVGIANRKLTLPTDCESYDPPLPPEYRQ